MVAPSTPEIVTGARVERSAAIDEGHDLAPAHPPEERPKGAEAVPCRNVESGNMLAKQLEYLAGAEVAGIVLGARVPIILKSRADKTRARLASCAVAQLAARP